MPRFIHFFMKYFLFLICLLAIESCCVNNSRDEVKQKYSESEVLTYYINENINVNGNYIFAVGPCCKPCVKFVLTDLDSIITLNESLGNKLYVFSSHQFVMDMSFKSLTIKYDETLEKLNYDFKNIIFVEFVNDSIINSMIMDVDNMYSFAHLVKNKIQSQ
jgi:hypothetical protein